MQEITGRTHIKRPTQDISKTSHPVLGHCLQKVMQVVRKILQKKGKIKNIVIVLFWTNIFTV